MQAEFRLVGMIFFSYNPKRKNFVEMAIITGSSQSSRVKPPM